MKKLSLVLGCLFTLLFIACEGPQGPPGFDGFNGRDGINGEDGIQAQIFEVDGVNLTYIDSENIWETAFTFLEFTNFEVLKEDVILVYRYDGPVEFNDGAVEDSWGLIPQNFFLNEGIIQYVSSHTLRDVVVLIDGDFDLINLNENFTDNQLFRIAIIPAVGASSGKMDTSSMSALMSSLGISEAQIKKIN